MDSNLLTIKQASEIIGVSIQTLRRWDKSGKLVSVRKKSSGHRYYSRESIEEYIKNNIKNIFKLARSWIINNQGNEPRPELYCSDSSVFQARLPKLQNELGEIKELKDIFPLILAITGEIGNNSFDHNLGNWPNIPGIFFAYSLRDKKIILADRGQGVLKTLKKVKPELKDHEEALKIAFTEIISARAPESRGNGLKFVKDVVINNEIDLFFQTGDAQLRIQKGDTDLKIRKSKINLQGCLVSIKF